MDDIFVFYKICKLLVAGKSKNHAWFVKRARKQSTMKVFLKINYFVRISWLRIQIHVLLWYSWTPHWATVPINKNAWANVSLYFYIGLKIRSTSKPHPIVPSFEIIFHFNKNQLSLVWRLLSFEHLRIPFILGFLIVWKFDQWFYWKKSKYANFTGS